MIRGKITHVLRGRCNSEPAVTVRDPSEALEGESRG